MCARRAVSRPHRASEVPGHGAGLCERFVSLLKGIMLNLSGNTSVGEHLLSKKLLFARNAVVVLGYLVFQKRILEISGSFSNIMNSASA
jgi:hypothetical protein